MRKAFCVLTLMAGLSGAALAQDVYTVRYTYPEGKQLVYENKASSSIKVNGARIIQQWKSLETGEPQGDGSTAVLVKLSDLFESEPVSGKIYVREILSRVARDSIFFRLDGLGDVSDVRVQRMDRMPFRDRQEKEMILLQFLYNYSASFPKLPTGEIPAKGGWEATKEVSVQSPPLELKDVYTSTFKVKKASKKDGYMCLEIEESTRIDIDGYMSFGQGTDSQLLPFKTVGTGTREGKFLLDTERGIILEYKGDANFTVKVGPVGSPESSMAESEASIKIERKLKAVESL